MTMANLKNHRLGWVGTGRMGYAMASRLLKNGCDVAVYNRTRSKAQAEDSIYERCASDNRMLYDHQTLEFKILNVKRYNTVTVATSSLNNSKLCH